MSQAALDNAPTPRRDRSLAVVGVFLFVSLGIHVGGFWALGEGTSRARPPAVKPVEMVMVEVQKPPPPPPPAPEEPKPEPPKPPPPKPKAVKPPPVKVAEAPKPVPPPPVDAPPPPNDTPPPEPQAKPPPLVVGMTMSSTTSAGSFAA
ncbi:hypothetical protein JJE73_14100, partial [Comamonas sp. JC664]|nr:hypothetical protein [Comamonas sp. JC664]